MKKSPIGLITWNLLNPGRHHFNESYEPGPQKNQSMTYAESHSAQAHIHTKLLLFVNILATSRDYMCKHIISVLPDDITSLELKWPVEEQTFSTQLTGIISRTSRRDFPFPAQVVLILMTSYTAWKSSILIELGTALMWKSHLTWSSTLLICTKKLARKWECLHDFGSYTTIATTDSALNT